MRHLTRHFAPGPLPLYLRHLFAGLGKVMYHQVVCPHKSGNFILLIVNDVFQSRSPGVYHLASHVNNRAEHLVNHSCREEPGRVHGVETLAAETLLVDVVPLVVIHDVPVRLIIGPGTDNHVFENLRRRGVEHFAARTVQRYVRPGVVSDIVDNG